MTRARDFVVEHVLGKVNGATEQLLFLSQTLGQILALSPHVEEVTEFYFTHCTKLTIHKNV